MSIRLFLLFLYALRLAVPAFAERPGYVTVLLYHRFDEPQHPTTNTQVEMFRQQLEYLREKGYRVLDMGEFRQLLEERKPFPSKAVLITIDDPYRCIYEKAYPVLQEFGYPFAVFVNASPLYSDLPGYMTWEMVEEMHRQGVTIGNHTYYHPRLGRPQSGQSREEYSAWVRHDLQRSRKALGNHGIDTDLLAYPFGEYNEVVVEEAVGMGFELMFTQDESGVDEQTDPRLIPRLAIVGANLDMERFAYKLNLAPLHVEEVEPGMGFLEANPPARFALRLKEPKRYRPGVINMFISEWGQVPAEYDAESGLLSFRPEQPLTRPLNRVIVTARERDGGGFSMFSRLYVRPFAELSGE